MFDLGIGELLVIGVFALIFVGPKDFTKMFRELGKFTAKLRKMARDFQRAMEDAADESGMRETASNLKKMTSAKELGLDAVKDAAKGWDPTKPSEKSAKPSEKAKSIGPETAKLSEERADQVRKVKDNMAKKGQEKLDAQKAAAESGGPEETGTKSVEKAPETATADAPESKPGEAS